MIFPGDPWWVRWGIAGGLWSCIMQRNMGNAQEGLKRTNFMKS